MARSLQRQQDGVSRKREANDNNSPISGTPRDGCSLPSDEAQHRAKKRRIAKKTLHDLGPADCHDQQQSPLFQLPAEVRNHIFDLVLEPTTYRGHTRVKNSRNNHRLGQGHSWHYFRIARRNPDWYVTEVRQTIEVALLRACRLAYVETRALPVQKASHEFWSSAWEYSSVWQSSVQISYPLPDYGRGDFPVPKNRFIETHNMASLHDIRKMTPTTKSRIQEVIYYSRPLSDNLHFRFFTSQVGELLTGTDLAPDKLIIKCPLMRAWRPDLTCTDQSDLLDGYKKRWDIKELQIEFVAPLDKRERIWRWAKAVQASCTELRSSHKPPVVFGLEGEPSVRTWSETTGATYSFFSVSFTWKRRVEVK